MFWKELQFEGTLFEISFLVIYSNVFLMSYSSRDIGQIRFNVALQCQLCFCLASSAEKKHCT